MQFQPMYNIQMIWINYLSLQVDWLINAFQTNHCPFLVSQLYDMLFKLPYLLLSAWKINSSVSSVTPCLRAHHICCQNWFPHVEHDFSAWLKISHVPQLKFLILVWQSMTDDLHIYYHHHCMRHSTTGRKHTSWLFYPCWSQLSTWFEQKSRCS